MSRPLRAPALVAVLLVGAVGCQDYNFNPVGHCLIQPGTKQFTLSGLDTADVLFVVDDSGSMGGEQTKLANAFDAFIENLSSTNVGRAQQGLDPFKYHLAVTTTSVYWNYQTGQTCRRDCTGAGGAAVCCNGTTPARQPRRCTTLGAGASECPVGGTVCSDTCTDRIGELFCCAAGNPGSYPAGAFSELIPCSREGEICGGLETHYQWPVSASPADCRNASSRWGSAATGPAGSSGNMWPFPHGQFVSWVGGATPNPRVLHFDEPLYKTGTSAQGFSRTQLEDFFRENVMVGTCGSGQEQALQAARIALQRAQGDTRDAAGAVQWNATKRTALANASWPNMNRDGTPAKTVLVFVGDEDDCSSPEDPSGGIVMLADPTGNDACTRNDGGKQFSASSFADFFTSLGRPIAAGFVFSTAASQCSGEGCTPGFCTDTSCNPSDPDCGGQAPGNRLWATANELRARGVDVVLGSMCDANFNTILDDIAEVAKPPQTLSLPTRPAEDAVALLRIARQDGTTRKICGRPLAPGAYANLQVAKDTGADWWFTATEDPGPPVQVSQYIYINPQGTCGLNANETWSADYLGVVPAGGCVDDADCTAKLGGTAGAFECFKPPGTPVGQNGTCVCQGSVL